MQMAIRYKKDNRSYEVYWNNPYTHRRESKSFKTKKEAEKENSMVLYRLQYDKDSFKKDITDSILAKGTLSELWTAYLNEKQFSRVNLRAYSYHMKTALRLIGHITLDKLTFDDLSIVKDNLIRNNHISQATVHTRLVLLRALVYYAVEHNYMKPIKFPRIPKANYQKFVPPTTEEISRIYKVAPEHIKRIIILGAFFGARVGRSELLQLTWDDVDISKKVLRIHGSHKNPNATYREVPIRDDLLNIILQWYEKDRELDTRYLVTYKGRQLSVFRNGWKATLARAGITRRIRPYDLRHAFGTELIANGADIGTVASLMGHSNPTMLLNHYQYVLDSQKVTAISKLPYVDFNVD